MVGTVRQIRQRESQNELNTSLRHISNYLENHAFCTIGSNTCEHYRRQSHDGWSKYRIHVQTWRLYTTIHVCWNICVWASNVWCNFASGTCYFLQWTTTSIAQRYRILRLTRQTSRDLHMGEAEQATLRSIRQPKRWIWRKRLFIASVCRFHLACIIVLGLRPGGMVEAHSS